MPVTIGVDIGGEARADFVADYPGSQYFLTGEVQLVAQCQHGRRQYGGGMSADTAQIIEVFRMTIGGIRKRGCGTRSADVGGDHARLRITALLTRELENDFAERCGCAVRRGADVIQYRLFRLLNSGGGYLIKLGGDNPTCQCFGGSHDDS